MRIVKLKAHRISSGSCLHWSHFIFLIPGLEGDVTAELLKPYSQGIKETLGEPAVKLAPDSLP